MTNRSNAREISAQMRADRQRQQRRQRNLRLGGGLVAALIVIAGLTWLGMRGTKPAAATPIEGLQTFSGLARGHVDGTVSYAPTPPVGGKHSPVWQNCGWYDTSVRNENAVHSMEHGAAWITYSPNLSAKDKATLKSELAGKAYVLASEYAGLPSPVVASAWGAQVRLTGVTDPRLEQFVARFANSASAPEPGGECAGGLGAPSN